MNQIDKDFVHNLICKIIDAKIEHQNILEFVKKIEIKDDETHSLVCNLQQMHWKKAEELKTLLLAYIDTFYI